MYKKSTYNSNLYDSSIYDKHIEDVLPFYSQYHEQIIDLVNTYKQDAIDSGCGTGSLAKKVLEKRKNVRFTLSDPSESMLQEAEKKLDAKENKIKFINMASHQFEFEEEFDIITAVQCHHYYTKDERKKALLKCYRALRKDGIFLCFENIKMSSEISDALAMKRWIKFLQKHGNSQEEIQKQIDRRGVETLPITVENHLEMLNEVGFRSVDLLWVSYLQAGFFAVK